MGATNKTTYYELSQFIGTDKPAWLQDYNGDMLKIDTAINNAKVAADNAANAASAAQGDATTALGDIASLNTTVGTISNTLNTAVGNINTINSLIGNGTPTTTDQTIIGAINELNGHARITSFMVTLGLQNADGVKTVKELIEASYAAASSYIAGQTADKKFEICFLRIGNRFYSLSGSVIWFGGSAISSFEAYDVNVGDSSATMVTAQYSNAANVRKLTIDGTPSATFASGNNDVVNSGNVSLYARVYTGAV